NRRRETGTCGWVLRSCSLLLFFLAGVRAGPAIDVVKALDVVFAEVVTALHLDEDHVLSGTVLQTMFDTLGYVGRLVGDQVTRFLTTGHGGHAAHHYPVLGAMMVQLQRQCTARLHDDALDLEAGIRGQTLVGAPGA